MTKEEYISILREACDRLAKIKDIKSFKKENPKELNNILLTIISYYNYINENFSEDHELNIQSYYTIYEITEKNPQLTPIIEILLGIDKTKTEEQSFQKENFQKEIIDKVIEFRDQRGFNTDNVDYYKTQFEKYLETLSINIKSFNQEEYEKLNSILLNEINRINKFNEIYEEKLSKFTR